MPTGIGLLHPKMLQMVQVVNLTSPVATDRMLVWFPSSKQYMVNHMAYSKLDNPYMITGCHGNHSLCLSLSTTHSVQYERSL